MGVVMAVDWGIQRLEQGITGLYDCFIKDLHRQKLPLCDINGIGEVKMNNLKLSLLGLVLFLIYCVSSRVTPYPQFNYPPTQPSVIQVYYMPPAVPFEIIGEVEGSGAALASWSTVRNYMRKKAASIGGDAIIIVNKKMPYIGTHRTPDTAKAFVYGNYIYYTYRPGTSYAIRGKYILGIVVKWK
jgi:hypothetical protein